MKLSAQSSSAALRGRLLKRLAEMEPAALEAARKAVRRHDELPAVRPIRTAVRTAVDGALKK